jgi:hypothetical protein
MNPTSFDHAAGHRHATEDEATACFRAASQERPPIDVDSLGLSDEQTRNLRQHLTARQQTLGEWIADVLFDYRMGRPDGIDYPPADRPSRPTDGETA